MPGQPANLRRRPPGRLSLVGPGRDRAEQRFVSQSGEQGSRRPSLRARHVVFVSHLHGDHFGGLPFLILDGQFSRRTEPLIVAGPPGTGHRLGEAMECLFPGSSAAPRRFATEVIELTPGSTTTVADVTVTAWAADHASGGPALILRLQLAGRTLAYTGDTAWTSAIAEAAADADLLIAEAYYRDKSIPYHLSQADLSTRRHLLTARRVILTHSSADLLDHPDHLVFETAHDGLVLSL